MSQAEDIGDEVEELDENDELGQIEAGAVPQAFELEPDPESDDPDYDEALSVLDPDEQGGDLALPEGDEPR